VDRRKGGTKENMKRLLKGTLKILDRVFESLMLDEETARKIASEYASRYIKQ
jgi:hypothetical protein